MRYLSKVEKAAQAENRKGIITLHEGLLVKMLSRPDYSEETKASLRRGGEAFLADLRGAS